MILCRTCSYPHKMATLTLSLCGDFCQYNIDYFWRLNFGNSILLQWTNCFQQYLCTQPLLHISMYNYTIKIYIFGIIDRNKSWKMKLWIINQLLPTIGFKAIHWVNYLPAIIFVPSIPCKWICYKFPYYHIMILYKIFTVIEEEVVYNVTSWQVQRSRPIFRKLMQANFDMFANWHVKLFRIN